MIVWEERIMGSLQSHKKTKKFQITAAAIAFLCICLLFLLFTLSPKKDAVTPPVSIGWNSSIYGPSGDKLSKSELGNQLGEIKWINEPMPTENGDSNNDYIPVSSKIFEIKGIDIKEAIAIEKNDAYYKFVKKASLK